MKIALKVVLTNNDPHQEANPRERIQLHEQHDIDENTYDWGKRYPWNLQIQENSVGRVKS